MTGMKAVPVRPKKADGPALEDGEHDERKAPERDKDNGAPQKSLHGSAGKDADVEEDQCKLQQRELREVQRSHDVEELEHLRDLFRT